MAAGGDRLYGTGNVESNVDKLLNDKVRRNTVATRTRQRRRWARGSAQRSGDLMIGRCSQYAGESAQAGQAQGSVSTLSPAHHLRAALTNSHFVTVERRGLPTRRRSWTGKRTSVEDIVRANARNRHRGDPWHQRAGRRRDTGRDRRQDPGRAQRPREPERPLRPRIGSERTVLLRTSTPDTQGWRLHRRPPSTWRLYPGPDLPSASTYEARGANNLPERHPGDNTGRKCQGNSNRSRLCNAGSKLAVNRRSQAGDRR